MLENIGLGLFPFTEVQHPEKNVFSISQRVRSIVSDEFPWVRWCFWRHHVFFCTTLHIGMNAFLAVASAFLFEYRNKMTTLFEEGGPMDQWGTNPTIILTWALQVSRIFELDDDRGSFLSQSDKIVENLWDTFGNPFQTEQFTERNVSLVSFLRWHYFSGEFNSKAPNSEVMTIHFNLS